jgi:hypothetical protein
MPTETTIPMTRETSFILAHAAHCLARGEAPYFATRDARLVRAAFDSLFDVETRLPVADRINRFVELVNNPFGLPLPLASAPGSNRLLIHRLTPATDLPAMPECWFGNLVGSGLQEVVVVRVSSWFPVVVRHRSVVLERLRITPNASAA